MTFGELREEYAGKKRDRQEVVFDKGARFFKDEQGREMFSFKADVGSEFVSKATDALKKQYPKEWAAFKGLKPRKD